MIGNDLGCPSKLKLRQKENARQGQKMVIISARSHKIDNLDDVPNLCYVLEVSQDEFAGECARSNHSLEANTRKSKKKRTIEAASIYLKTILPALLDQLLIHLTQHNATMGFERDKSIAMNNQRPRGFFYLFTTDFKSFFHSIKTPPCSPMCSALQKVRWRK